MKVFPTWQLAQSRPACPAASGNDAGWANRAGDHEIATWQRWQSLVQPCATWFGLVARARSSWWQEAHAVSAPEKLFTWAPGWHRKHAAAAWAPTSGKRVRLWRAMASRGVHASSLWQSAQRRPSWPRCTSTWHPAHPWAAKSPAFPRSLWQSRHAAPAWAPWRGVPVSVSWWNSKSARIVVQSFPVWHRVQSAGNVS